MNWFRATPVSQAQVSDAGNTARIATRAGFSEIEAKLVLSSDLVRARRRGDVLQVTELRSSELPEVHALAELMLAEVRASEQLSLEDVEVTLGAVPRAAPLEKVWAGLRKIILDHCEFTGQDGPEP